MKSHHTQNIPHAVSAVIACALLLISTAAPAAVIVTAGNVQGIAGSSANEFPSVTLNAVYGGTQTDGVIHMLLDLGSIQNIDKITIVNRATASTSFAIRSLSIWVAPDESIGGFNPLSLSSYTTSVFTDQLLNPASTAASVVRTADIVNSEKRYFLLNISSSYFTNTDPFSTAANMSSVQYSDIQVTAVPEPATTILLGAAFSLLFLIRRRTRLGMAK